jgi:preprotein translocase subunit Sec63
MTYKLIKQIRFPIYLIKSGIHKIQRLSAAGFFPSLPQFSSHQINHYYQRRDGRTKFLYIQLTIIGIAWAILLKYSQTIYSNQQSLQVWDPFQILDVSRFSSISYIKRQYKRKSLKFHPDKCSRKSKEKCEMDFLKLTKAYQV